MNRAKLNFLLLIILAVLVIILINSADTLNPSSSLYSLKRFRENIEVNLSLSQNSKAETLTKLLNHRLEEIKFLVDSNNYDPLEISSNRYNSIAGQLIELLPKLNKEEVDKIKNKIKNHPQVLANLKEKFGSQSAYSLILPQNIDTVNRILGQ